MLCFKKFSGAKKTMDKGGGGVSKFPVDFFSLTVAKKLVVEPFGVSLNSDIGNFYASEGYVTIFCRILLLCSTEKFCGGTLLC